LSEIISAMEYARTKNANIINASYGGGDFSQTESDEISSLNTKGILFIAAAGNEGANNDSTPSYPGSYDLPNIIAVAATDQTDGLAWFSNYGSTSVDVAAPGTNIYSTKPGRATAWSDDFDDNGISGWTVDAPWDLSTNAYSGSYSLAFVPGGSGATKGDRSARPTNAFDLSGKTGVQLTFKFTGEISSGDRLYVETAPSASGPWTNRPVLVNDAELFENGISGTAGGWLDAVVDLGAADGVSGLFFRFRYHAKEESSSGGGGGSGGGLCFISTVAFPLSLQNILGPATARAAGAVYIDDVQITTAGVEDVYQFLNGTSMATPHVVGLAALVWSQAPTPLTANEVKARILNSVERLTSLARQVVTWGRINASRSIANVPAEPVGLAATARSSSRIDLSWANTYYGQIGFRIERKEGAGGTFTQIAELGMGTNNTSYNDSNGLSTGRTYYYRVRAYYSGGTVSGYSAEAAATTL
jgi:subtilisin family serine protease